MPRVVILGGGFAGINLATKLKNQRFQVVLIDQNNFHTFQPLLYQVATAGLEPDSIAYPIRKMYSNQEEFYFRMGKVNRIDVEKNELYTSIGNINYDYLVLATGATTNFFGLDSIEQHAMTMKSVSEALDIRSLILQNFEKALLVIDKKQQEALMTFVIVGAGPTGVELAGALAELKRHVLPNDYPDLDIRQMQIHLIEMADQVLPPMSNKASAKAFEYLEDRGVTIWLKHSVENYDGEIVRFKSGKEILAKTLIWAAGVKGNVIAGLNDDSIERGRYKVDRYSKVEGCENIYAIGDVSLMKTVKFPNGLPMLAPAAVQQGVLLAKNLMAIEKKEKLKEFVYHDKGTMATIGRNRAVVDLKTMKFQGVFAWYVWMFVHLFSLIGFRNKLITILNWTYSYMSFDRGFRLIIRRYEGKPKKIEEV